MKRACSDTSCIGQAPNQVGVQIRGYFLPLLFCSVAGCPAVFVSCCGVVGCLLPPLAMIALLKMPLSFVE